MLTKNTLTPELQIERWEDRRDIKNLMGRYAYDLLIKNEKNIYAAHWSTRPDVCLMYPWGTYRGAAAVRDFYAALEAEGFTRQRTRTGNIINGLQLKTHADPKDEFSDFLS